MAVASLYVWMNGEFVGEWSALRTGTPIFRYARAWVESRYSRALSLSLPITADREIRGAVVDSYFENLLPDTIEIRRRMKARFGTASLGAFDLLSATGRDCVGAVQLLPPDEAPAGWNRVATVPLSTAEVEQTLLRVTAPALGQNAAPQEEFRISIAGAQEKTALLFMGGKWHLPQNATPTTHILKLPLGLVGGMRADMSDSVENEWLCAQLLRKLGLPTAASEMQTFGQQKVLVVKRFDRRWMGVETAAAPGRKGFSPTSGMWIARLPQEDFCQALGVPPERKYEVDGGPAIERGLQLLSGSTAAHTDIATFVLAQLAFWVLAATDGHAKNFSLQHATGGQYRMTPLYDVISAWPIIGAGGSQIPRQKVRLAMSLRGQRRHYKMDEILPRHWRALVLQSGVPDLWQHMMQMIEAVEHILTSVGDELPRSFPERIFSKIAAGARQQARRFLASVERG